jgi:hypothetical protein
MTVAADGARVEFDCAHGSIDEPPVLDSDGQFSLSGAYVRERGGPVHEGEPEDRQAAIYFGRLQGSRVTLSLQLAEDATTIGPFTAALGQPGTLIKCL